MTLRSGDILPLAAAGGLEQRIEYSHVGDGVLDGIRNLAPFQEAGGDIFTLASNS